jgi:two-component system response regulator BaeR
LVNESPVLFRDMKMETAEILLIEDEPNIREVVTLYLKRAGYTVRSVADGDTAIEELERNPPDLVLLDLMLPGVDGYEITEWLRSFSEIPLIMLTARREITDRIAGLEMGASACSAASLRRSPLEFRTSN